MVALVIFEIDVEIMEIPASSPHDDNFFDHNFTLSQRNQIYV
jgi:hypothetical protein